MESRISSMYHPQFRKDYSTYEETGKYVHTQEKNLFLENPHIGIKQTSFKETMIGILVSTARNGYDR